MKKYLFLLLFALCLQTANAQKNYKVSTKLEKKGILIEEYTGIGCGNCPDGHIVSEGIRRGSEGQVYLVSIHAGHYAGTCANGMDFKTEEGEKLVQAFNVQGFPSATINRHEFEKDQMVYYRSIWTDYTKQEKTKDAPMNLHVESSYDDKTRELQIHVEGYSTVDNSKENLKLNVILTQDYIIAEQNGVQEKDYTHMHVLRDYITDFFGDAIETKGKGEYFIKDYKYIMPKVEKNVEFVPGNVNVIAFVTSKGTTEIVNVKGCKPSYKNMEVEAGAELYKPAIQIGNKYGFDFFEAEVRNISTEKLTKAKFEVKINNDVQNITIDCNINPFERGAVKIPCKYNFSDKGIAKYEIKLVKLNENNVETKPLAGQFSKPNVSNENVSVAITTDICADENTFTLLDQDGNVIKEFGPFKSGETNKYNEILVLEEGKTYCIEITDMYGNGMEKGGKGSLITKSGTGKLIDQLFKINGYGIRSFFTIDKTLGIGDINVTRNENGTACTLNGTIIGKGSSYKGIVIKDGKKFISK